MQPEESNGRDLEKACIAYIQESGMRLTEPRRVILRAALGLKDAFDAETLCRLAKKEDPVISLATVYRTLPILLESGIIRKRFSDEDKQLYEGNTHSKGKIIMVSREEGVEIPFEDDCLWLRLQFLAKQKGYIAKNMDIRIEVERA